MIAVPETLFEELRRVLAARGEPDLVRRLEELRPTTRLTTGQVARILGVASANTVKNWLEAGYFPGAHKTAGGHWRFDSAEVEAVRARMEILREKNRHGDLTAPDAGAEDYPEPPLL